MKIKKGDSVKILSGKDRGKTGTVLRVMPTQTRLVVEGINMVKKHQKSKTSSQKGQRLSIASPLAISNVQLVCPKCGKASRIGYKVTDAQKHRICKKCKAEI